MKTKLLVLSFLLITGMVWGQKNIKNNVSAAYIAPTGALNKNFEISSGAFVFDATKRMGVANIYKKKDNTYVFKYLGEEQPDAVYETIKEFLAKAGANINGQQFNAEVVNNVNSMVQNLTEKSKAHIFLRSSLYRVNEAVFNEDIEEATYMQLFSEIIQAAKDIQIKELETENQVEQRGIKKDEEVKDEVKNEN